MMMFNNAFLKFDQVGFQQILYVGVSFFIIKDSLNDSYTRIFCRYVWALSDWKPIDPINQWRLLPNLRSIEEIGSCTLWLRFSKRSFIRRSRWYAYWITLVKKNCRKLIYDRIKQTWFICKQIYTCSFIIVRLVYCCQLFLCRAIDMGKRKRMQIFQHWWLWFIIVLFGIKFRLWLVRKFHG